MPLQALEEERLAPEGLGEAAELVGGGGGRGGGEGGAGHRENGESRGGDLKTESRHFRSGEWRERRGLGCFLPIKRWNGAGKARKAAEWLRDVGLLDGGSRSADFTAFGPVFKCAAVQLAFPFALLLEGRQKSNDP